MYTFLICGGAVDIIIKELSDKLPVSPGSGRDVSAGILSPVDEAANIPPLSSAVRTMSSLRCLFRSVEARPENDLW